MDWVTFLILFPLIPAILLLFTKKNYSAQKWIVLVSSALICIGVIALAVEDMASPGIYYIIHSGFANAMVVVGDIVLALTFLYVCRKLPFKKYWIPAMVIIQYGLVIAWDLSGRIPDMNRYIYVDNLSIIMALVIGIVGTIIAVYTVDYMKKYHEQHTEISDRSHLFIATIFLFFFAMFGIIFSNSIDWIYFFWEITTLCSFIMIGYSRKPEAHHNSFRALWMLLLGGLGFAMAVLYAADVCKTVDLQMLLTMKKSIVLLPVLLLCFAGMNKAAQYPFGNWLLGAMVAPTPSSALLHSSTMVKAGVYMVLRCAPVLQNSAAGAMVAIIGGVSFLAGSALAISQRDSKKVLAYSTIANLGLIILCAGIGSKFLLDAALLLIIFHAVAKALLFLCVGSVSQVTGSLSIDNMRGFISRHFWITIAMIVGLGGMFLAPFGMLISKMAVIEALAVRNPIFPPIVIFGGSLMLFFYVKWMGNLITVTSTEPPKTTKGLGLEWFSLLALSVLTVATVICYPFIGKYWIQPMYGWTPMFSEGVEITILIMLALIIVPPIFFMLRRSKLVYTEPYLSGVNVKDRTKYLNSLGKEGEWSFTNYYIDKYFSEEKLLKATIIGSLLLWILMFFMETL
ncbi:MAG TPA: proton-conducting transporter membrane subunit [Victivallales bacterium]|nr:proton-conducting transporter membrane subunit [Victivallales bacterium]